MNTATTIEELRNERNQIKGIVGLVPTMGYLHPGHISLVEKARSECDYVIVSIFVNPTQFAPSEDLSSYPRDLQQDFKYLEEAGTDLVWTPTDQIMYPHGYQTWITVDQLTQPLEGQFRPEHFRGVTTIVAKLFNVVQPQCAYFGQKDAQQAAVIQRMIIDLDFPINMVVCPIIREADNLAMSSRNAYLSDAQRKAATILSKSLFAAHRLYEEGERNATVLKESISQIVQSEPLANLQYVSCADPLSLQEVDKITSGALLSMAVYIGKTRLIDNILLK
ncbi:MAG: pantoate--beta-alanine ligase [Anaerolineaceae bacterium]|nr:pantoate--beta-alanine ligase [Anaerolineaceae bacterium]